MTILVIDFIFFRKTINGTKLLMWDKPAYPLYLCFTINDYIYISLKTTCFLFSKSLTSSNIRIIWYIFVNYFEYKVYIHTNKSLIL